MHHEVRLEMRNCRVLASTLLHNCIFPFHSTDQPSVLVKVDAGLPRQSAMASAHCARILVAVSSAGLFCLMWIFVENQYLLSHIRNEKQSSYLEICSSPLHPWLSPNDVSP